MSERTGRFRSRVAALVIGGALGCSTILGAASLAHATAPAVPSPQPASASVTAPDFHPGAGDGVTLIGPTYPDREPAHPSSDTGQLPWNTTPRPLSTGSFGSS